MYVLIKSKTRWEVRIFIEIFRIIKRAETLLLFFSLSSIFKVPISCLGILHICNLWILLRKIVIYLVGRKFYLRGLFFAVKVDGSDVIVGTPECFNIQARHKFENFCLFSLNSTYSNQNQVRYFQMSKTVSFRYKRIPTVTSLQPIQQQKSPRR